MRVFLVLVLVLILVLVLFLFLPLVAPLLEGRAREGGRRQQEPGVSEEGEKRGRGQG